MFLMETGICVYIFHDGLFIIKVVINRMEPLNCNYTSILVNIKIITLD